MYICTDVTNLASVTISSKITSIAVSAFENCPSLKVIKIPSSVTRIDENAFYNCSSLSNVYFLGNIPIINNTGNFLSNTSDTAYYIVGETDINTKLSMFTTRIELTQQEMDNPTIIPPSAPLITSITAANQSATINFTQIPSDSTITNYAYSMNGINFIDFNPSQTASPLTIDNLILGQTYNITIKAFKDVNGLYSDASNSVSVTLNSPPLAPTITSVTTSNQLATVIFTQPTNTGSGSLPITSMEYSTDNGVTYTSINQIESPLLIPLVSSRNSTYLIKIRGNNGISGQASNLFTFRKFTSIGKIV